jgi:hypothetical protein
MRVDEGATLATCPECGAKMRFLLLPLYLVTGASGTGKSSVCNLLPPLLPECVSIEGDILWRREFAGPSGNDTGFLDTWMRMARAINQNGRPTVFCGTAIPEKLEYQKQRRYFSELFYLALVCDDEILEGRLQNRPQWRFHDAERSEVIERTLNFNRWIRENATNTSPPMSLLDTSVLAPDAVAERVGEWVRARLPGKHDAWS